MSAIPCYGSARELRAFPEEASMPNQEQDRTATRPADGSSDDPLAHPADPGAYVGNRPERQAETIPGGITDDDERIAAHSTQREPVADDSADPPDLREAGQSR
ncbi:MAG: hypothetical protein ACJ77X_08340 [Chloroflexota bacterium]